MNAAGLVCVPKFWWSWLTRPMALRTCGQRCVTATAMRGVGPMWCFGHIWPRCCLPGNLGWLIRPADIEKLIFDPRKFYNLDLCAFASPITHPRRWQRWLANISYLAVILGLGPLGKCATSPLLPQGQGGLYGWFASKINRYMPFDR